MASNRRYCFYPNHEIKQIDSPCFPDKDISPCCSDDMVCLGNGLCHNEKTGILTRGTCTDRTWKSPYCPQYCLKSSFNTGLCLLFVSLFFYSVVFFFLKNYNIFPLVDMLTTVVEFSCRRVRWRKRKRL